MDLTYGRYLKVDELLDLQECLSDGPEHDEMLFIVIHQVYELWFKEVLHEADMLVVNIEAGRLDSGAHQLKRILKILKTLVAQLDVLETMTPLACGEGGIMTTNDQRIYERALAYGHYARHRDIQLPDIAAGSGLPWGGFKHRMHQLSSAMARVQLRRYPEQMAEIDKAMNLFWDLLEGVPGVKEHRPPKDSGCTMGGWYAAHGLYRPEELGGLSVHRFCEAVTAEGAAISPGCNKALHLHPVFNTLDVYGEGKPTRIANLPDGVDVRQPPGSLPVAEGIQERVFNIPWFKRYRPEIIGQYASAIRKVADHYTELLADDPGNPPEAGSWFLSQRKGT